MRVHAANSRILAGKSENYTTKNLLLMSKNSYRRMVCRRNRRREMRLNPYFTQFYFLDNFSYFPVKLGSLADEIHCPTADGSTPP